MAELLIEYREVPVEDGSKMRVYYARPATASRRFSLLLFQEAFGVNEHIRDVAQRFAREGYVVAAPNCFTAPLQVLKDHTRTCDRRCLTCRR